MKTTTRPFATQIKKVVPIEVQEAIARILDRHNDYESIKKDIQAIVDAGFKSLLLNRRGPIALALRRKLGARVGSLEASRAGRSAKARAARILRAEKFIAARAAKVAKPKTSKVTCCKPTRDPGPSKPTRGKL